MSSPFSPPSLGLDSFSNILPGSTTSALKNAQTTPANTNPNPWDNVPTKPRFFFPIQIKGDRWDKLFPYRFVVIDTSKGNRIVNGPSTNAHVTVTSAGVNGNFTIAFQNQSTQWSVQLPITPEQLNITDVFSITTSATLRGIMEEHNGVRFKTITASGTFGTWPSRPNITQPPGTPSVVQSLFGGTLEAASNLVGGVQRLINTATTGHPASKPVTRQPQDTVGLTSTGYYQAMFVQQFLEQYAEAKRDPANAGWRLVLDLPKQNQSFIVTPLQFTWQQGINKPTQIYYNLQLKAWRRIDLRRNVFTLTPTVPTINPGILQAVLNTLAAARNIVSQSLSLLQAVASDIEAPLEALRQTTLLVKGLAGVAITAADLPSQIVTAYKSAIMDALNTFSSPNQFPTAISSNPTVTQAFNSIKAAYAQQEGLSPDAVAAGQLGAAAAAAQSINPTTAIFANAPANYALLDQVPVQNMVLSTAQQDEVDLIQIEAASLTVNQLKGFRQTILTLALQLSNSFGTGSAFYNKVFNLPPPATLVTPITLDNYELLDALYDTMQQYDVLTATTQIDANNIQSSMQYVAGLAAQSEIAFNIPNSMILAPVPFGLTIEAIAARYTGDPQAWLEIATLNNLQAPYIDEDGFQYDLLSNGDGRQVIVGDNTNLYIGQTVTIYSATQSPTARHILAIETLSSTSYLITLDGLPNLNSYLLSDSAYLQAYLPGTVNSQQKIYIPSTQAVPNNPVIIVPASTSVDPLTGLSQVDFLLTETGDLAVNNFGDFRYSYGMTNIIQALKIKMSTQAGSMLLHPNFGVGINAGTINGGIDAQEIFSSINTLIQQDPRFSGLNSLQVSLQGPVLTINMAVQLANQSGVFPITFQVTPTS